MKNKECIGYGYEWGNALAVSQLSGVKIHECSVCRKWHADWENWNKEESPAAKVEPASPPATEGDNE